MKLRTAVVPLALLGAGLAVASCSDDPGQEEAFAGECKTPGVAHVKAFPALRFKEPVAMKQIPNDKGFFFVAEHGGVIKRVANQPNVSKADVFADLTDRVHYDWEAGLNGMAFHPRFAENGEVYITYNGFPEGGQGGRDETKFTWILSRFVSRDGGKTLDESSEQVVLRIAKDNNGANRDHNSGDISFGPDGLLYISVGDGGTQHDPELDAVRLSSLSGKVLRIDVNQRRPSENIHYAIPESNPFVNTPGARGEIFAYGFRNPWRLTHDRVTGEVWVGESGQNAVEEIELVRPGEFHGWPLREGILCHDRGPGCSNAALQDLANQIQQNVGDLGVDPVWAFWHKPNGANATIPPYLISAIGGYVYRGSAIEGLQGVYFFANFDPGEIYGLYKIDGQNTPLLVDRLPRVSSFAEDLEGELYVLEYSQGNIYKLIQGPCATRPEAPEDSYTYLVMDGVGSEKDAFSYYDSIGAARDLSLQRWIEQSFGELEQIEAVYKNDADLGFFREMHCTKVIERGRGGCWVRNWDNEDNPTSENRETRKDLGTVTMNISPEGFTRFYIFGPPADARIQAGNANNADRILSPLAVLDSEGEKYLPQLCTPCHGGKYSGAPDVGSVWREFEPAAFKKRAAVSQEQAEQEWFALNQAMIGANKALASEAEGGTQGIDQGRANMVAYLEAIFDTSVSPPRARSFHDPIHLPADWTTPSGNEIYDQSKADLWTDFVNPYCQTCHRANNNFNFAVFANFQNLAAEANGEAAIYGFINEDPDDPERVLLPFMPQAEFLKNILKNDNDAFAAVDSWLVQERDPSVPQCEVRFIMNQADHTQVGQDIGLLGNIEQLGGWRPESGGVRMTTVAGLWPTWTVEVSLPQGMAVEFKGGTWEGDAFIGWEAGNNHAFRVPEGRTGCTFEVKVDWQDF
jgi:glucose/arabinose dehydrogenase